MEQHPVRVRWISANVRIFTAKGALNKRLLPFIDPGAGDGVEKGVEMENSYSLRTESVLDRSVFKVSPPSS